MCWVSTTSYSVPKSSVSTLAGIGPLRWWRLLGAIAIVRCFTSLGQLALSSGSLLSFNGLRSAWVTTCSDVRIKCTRSRRCLRSRVSGRRLQGPIIRGWRTLSVARALRSMSSYYFCFGKQPLSSCNFQHRSISRSVDLPRRFARWLRHLFVNKIIRLELCDFYEAVLVALVNKHFAFWIRCGHFGSIMVVLEVSLPEW